MPQVDLDGRGGAEGVVWYGKNRKRHGGEFFLGVSGSFGTESVCIPHGKQKAVARLLRRLADRMDPPTQRQTDQQEGS